MQPDTLNYEYSYENKISFHHHAYLINPLLELLSQSQTSNKQPLRILDLGCGNGSLSHLIAQQGHDVVGIEDSASGVEIAQHSFPNCRFIKGSIYELPYQDLGNSFDVVISAEVIEHLMYPRELPRAAKHCLKPDGRLIITTPYHGYVKNLVLALTNKMDQHFTTLWDGGHVKFFSVETMTKLLTEEGYTDMTFKFAGRYPLLWKSMLCSCTPA